MVFVSPICVICVLRLQSHQSVCLLQRLALVIPPSSSIQQSQLPPRKHSTLEIIAFLLQRLAPRFSFYFVLNIILHYHIYVQVMFQLSLKLEFNGTYFQPGTQTCKPPAHNETCVRTSRQRFTAVAYTYPKFCPNLWVIFVIMKLRSLKDVGHDEIFIFDFGNGF